MTNSRRVALCLLCLQHLLLILEESGFLGYLIGNVIDVDCNGCITQVNLLLHSDCQEYLILFEAFKLIFDLAGSCFVYFKLIDILFVLILHVMVSLIFNNLV